MMGPHRTVIESDPVITIDVHFSPEIPPDATNHRRSLSERRAASRNISAAGRTSASNIHAFRTTARLICPANANVPLLRLTPKLRDRTRLGLALGRPRRAHQDVASSRNGPAMQTHGRCATIRARAGRLATGAEPASRSAPPAPIHVPPRRPA